MKTKLDKYFRISQRGSTIGTELIGGATTFATMAYILAYMTGAMSAVPGIDLTGVLLCTALITAISCIAMGLVANAPIALAPVPSRKDAAVPADNPPDIPVTTTVTGSVLITASTAATSAAAPHTPSSIAVCVVRSLAGSRGIKIEAVTDAICINTTKKAPSLRIPAHNTASTAAQIRIITGIIVPENRSPSTTAVPMPAPTARPEIADNTRSSFRPRKHISRPVTIAVTPITSAARSAHARIRADWPPTVSNISNSFHMSKNQSFPEVYSLMAVKKSRFPD